MKALKDAIIDSPALISIDYSSDRPVYVGIDSSSRCVGWILSHDCVDDKRRPARFGSISWKPKLELYGPFRALRALCVHLIGIRNLVVEMDAQFIRGMLRNPDIQPNATINHWIAAILLFDFKLVHIPADKHHRPDGLSRRAPAEGEEEEDDPKDWIDQVLLLGLWVSSWLDSPHYAQVLSLLRLLPAMTQPPTIRWGSRSRRRHLRLKRTWHASNNICTPCGFPQIWTTRPRPNFFGWWHTSSYLMVDSGDGRTMDDINFTFPLSSDSASSATPTTTLAIKAFTSHAAPSSTISGGLHSSTTSSGTSLHVTSASSAKPLRSVSRPPLPLLHPSSAKPTPTLCLCLSPPVSVISSKLDVPSPRGPSGACFVQKPAVHLVRSSSKRSCADGSS